MKKLNHKFSKKNKTEEAPAATEVKESSSRELSVEEEIYAEFEALVASELKSEPQPKEEESEPQEAAEEPQPKKKRRKLLIIIPLVIILLVLIALGVIYYQGYTYFSTHFYNSSTISGVDSSGATVEEMAEVLSARAAEYSMTLLLADDETVVLSAEELGVDTEVSVEVMQAILDSQDPYTWYTCLWEETEYSYVKLFSYDKSVMKATLRQLDCVTTSDYRDYEDAYIDCIDGEYVIVPEVYGTKMVVANLIIAVRNALDVQATEVDVTGCYLQPQLTTESEELLKVVNGINNCLDTDFAYTIGSETVAISSETIGSWISLDEDYNLVYDEESMAEFVAEMASTYNTYGKSKTLVSQYGTTVTVPGGNYGWKVDKSGELAQLKEDIITGETIRRDLVYSVTAASRGSTDYGNSYIEINKTAQRLFLIINGECVLETAVVTGAEDQGNGTSCGAFAITYCTTDVYLTGETYRTHVNYWMPFNGNIGLHDATWQKAFGGTRYLDGYGSHGCVNLPYSAAKTIYSYVCAGFPVLMYELSGTQTVDTLSKQAAASCETLIDAIGTVTLNSSAAITAAETAYDALGDGGKSCVSNYDVLVAARTRYNELVAAAESEAAAAEAAAAEAAATTE